MNRLLSSSSGVLEPLGNQNLLVCHNDRDGLWGGDWEWWVFSIRTSCCEGLPHSGPSVCRPLCSPMFVGLFVSMDTGDGVTPFVVINDTIADCWCLPSVFWCHTCADWLAYEFFFILSGTSGAISTPSKNQISVLAADVSLFSYEFGFNSRGCSWEATCYTCFDSISEPLPVSDIQVCNTLSHGLIRLAWAGAPPPHTRLSIFQQIKSLKTQKQVWRQSVSQHTTWCCLHSVIPQHVPTGELWSTLSLS